ncbi:MAG: adenosylcobinamide-phosphate synthase CbiB [Desulfobacterales bacterium]|nr:adenosylcobinamide-phosphate synthase CbiB [Desulfobacterales bacterium]
MLANLDLLTLPTAFVLDLLIGDPLWMPHPVRWMGKAIERCEPLFRSRFGPPEKAGLRFAVYLISATLLIAAGAVWLARMWHPVAAWILEVVLIYYCLSARSLLQAGWEVIDALENDGVAAGRRMVAHIVGRDVSRLSATGVSRAALESVAENMVDGVLAPLFFAFLGGAPLALAYKMVNTLDSMVGYQDERYRLFGRAAARIDDAANWLPARLAVPLTALGAWLTGFDARRAWITGWQEGHRHASPNAGYAEAAFAGALGVRLGGPNVYHGRRVDKPWIGEGLNDVKPVDIARSGALMLTTSILAMLTLWGLGVLIQFGL